MSARTLLVVLLTLLGIAGAAQAEQIASYQGLTASAPDGASCGSSARVTINAPNASAYNGDRVALQNLIGGVRANYADCPGLRSLDLTGLENGRPVFQATITAQNGWRLPTGIGRIVAENPAPGLETKSAHCDYDPNDPFVGCWVGLFYNPGSMLNVRRDHSWYEGSAAGLASGAVTVSGPEIDRAYTFGAGAMADVLDWNGRRHQIAGAGPVIKLYLRKTAFEVTFQEIQGPYFGFNCNLMVWAPYAPFGINLEGTTRTVYFRRLRPLTITADIFTKKGHPQHIEESLPENPRFANCPNNYRSAITDRFVSPAMLLAAPMFAEMSVTKLRWLFPAVLVEEAEIAGVGRGVIAGETRAGVVGAAESAPTAPRAAMSLPEARVYAANRAEQLQSQLPNGSRGRVTMGVGVLRDSDGNQIVAVSTSEPRGYLRPGVTLDPGEVLVPGSGHAETDIVDWAARNGYTVETIGAGRPICPSCASAIGGANATTSTPLRAPK